MKIIRSYAKTVPIWLLLFTLILPIAADGVFPQASADGGTAYRDRLLFLGESTTYHLRARGVLTGGTATDRVIAPRSGTMMLDRRILSSRVLEPQSGKEMTVTDAIAARQPEILVLSFGLNGIVGFLADHSRYSVPYRALIRAVHEVSPETIVILQTVYPVAEAPAEWKFDRSPAEINQGILELNRILPEIAEAEGAYVVDTAATVRGEDGYLRAEYSSDGIHLTRAGYEQVLLCLQTHPVEVAR